MASEQDPGSSTKYNGRGGLTNEELQKALEDLKRPCKIVNVNFEGVKRTSRNLIAKCVSDLFKSETLLDYADRYVRVIDSLNSLNAFKDVKIQMQPNGNRDEYEVDVIVEEQRRLRGSVQTAVDEHTSHLKIEATAPNISGIGDSLRFDIKSNLTTTKLYSGECRYTVPLIPWRRIWNPTFAVYANHYQFDSQPSGIDQTNKAFVNQVSFLSHPNVHHLISFENVWRHIKSSSVHTPIEIREQSGHSVKSSVRHDVVWDNRQYSFGGNFASEGARAKLSNEFTLNLVNGSADHTRHEAHLQFNTLILPIYDTICQLDASAGTLLRSNKVNICDKFFPGGPSTVRGFEYQCLGPSVRGRPLGAKSYISAGLHLYPILPYTTPFDTINRFIRPHIFVNAGTVGDLRLPRRREDLQRFRDSLRYSCGFGLVFYIAKIRCEVNYCLPIVSKEGDRTVKGLQFGLGVNFGKE